jgi:hypothetical protein
VPRPVPADVNEMKAELMHCVQVTCMFSALLTACNHRFWQESKFKEALRWSVNILKLEPSNAVILEYQVTCGAWCETHCIRCLICPQPLLAAAAIRSTMKAQSSSDDSSDNGSSSSGDSSGSASDGSGSSESESESDSEGECDKENVDSAQKKMQTMGLKP